MRRAIIFVMVVSMAALASTPAPECGLFSSQVTEGDAAQSQKKCDGMDMRMGVQDDVPHLSPCCQPSMTDCMTSQNLRPALWNESNEIPNLMPRVSANAETNNHFVLKDSISIVQWEEISDPRIQSLLCTFLI